MAKIVVLVKQVPDVEAVRIDPRTSEPDVAGAGLKVSDYDKNAVEAAVQLKEKNAGSRVVALSLGGPKVEESLKETLAMGCDEAVVLRDPAFEKADTAEKARLLALAVAKIGGVDLVIGAEESADSHSAQTGPRVAEHLGWGLVAYVTSLKLEGGKVIAERDIDEGIDVVEGATPLVLTVTESLNEPRLPALMHILQAKNKPVKVMSAADLGAGDVKPLLARTRNVAPKQERKQQMIPVESPEKAADDLVKILVKEGVIG
ncbi:MAG TPA: electron transfer flavoprotein subunit beta/FixA family protein [Candidatus Thermoplasmatota archaeon]|nr:electron transfer flavoprotein subunit beta/FixA family protein [Candidatus Thermoplasmatota archaeon]